MSKDRIQPSRNSGVALFGIIGSFCALCASPSPARADSRSQAMRLFDRLAGIPIQMSDPRLAQMQDLLSKGDAEAAARIASSDDGFVNVTVRHFATPLSNVAADPLQPLNDLVATVMGVARDNQDARSLLNGNFIYRGDPSIALMSGQTDANADSAVYFDGSHFTVLDSQGVNLAKTLVQAKQKSVAPLAQPTTGNDSQIVDHPDSAGVLTTRAWAEAYLIDGTNRRAIQYAFDRMLCMPIRQIADATMPDDRIRQDVTRTPGGDLRVFESSCRGCHSVMDGMGGAYAYYDFNGRNIGGKGSNTIIYDSSKVQQKMIKNSSEYQAGYRTHDDSWVNYATQNQNASIGWKSQLTGRGVSAFGAMLAETDQFASCMAQRAFTEVCRRPPDSSEAQVISGLAQSFKASGYKLRTLFEKAAVVPACLGS